MWALPEAVSVLTAPNPFNLSSICSGGLEPAGGGPARIQLAARGFTYLALRPMVCGKKSSLIFSTGLEAIRDSMVPQWVPVFAGDLESTSGSAGDGFSWVHSVAASAGRADPGCCMQLAVLRLAASAVRRRKFSIPAQHVPLPRRLVAGMAPIDTLKFGWTVGAGAELDAG